MNSTVRILSVAAAAAFTALGAQASELYGADFEARVQSTRSRAEVQAEATQAVTQFKNFVAVESNAAPSSVERASEHPLAAAVVAAAQQRQLPLLPVEGFDSPLGKGVLGRVQGTALVSGSARFLQEHGIDRPELIYHPGQQRAHGRFVLKICIKMAAGAR